MTLALYRKYRPRTFAEVIGQEHVTEPLSQALRSGRLNHAYLFSGPRGCGKTTSARIMARSLNCEQGPTPEPCGKCASCRSLAADGTGSIDVIEIDAASHGGVDDARELRERAFFAPANSRFKIYIIDEAHMVSTQGFNALLKLVEEPPEYVKFIFATTEPEKVLGTIRSRTHHYPFRLFPPKVVRPYLEQLTQAEGVAVEPAVFPLVVRAGGGSMRDSLSVLDQLIAGAGPEGVSYARAVSLLGVTDSALIDEMCDALAAGDGTAAYATVDRVAEAGHDMRRFASDLLERLRDLIVLQQVPDAAAKGLIDGPADQIERMAAQASQLGPATLSRCADIVHDGLVEMRGTTAPRLLLELICARMLLPGVDDSTGGLLQRLERMERRLTVGGTDAPSAAAGSAPANHPGVRPQPAAPVPAAATPVNAPTSAPPWEVDPAASPGASAPAASATGAPASDAPISSAPSSGAPTSGAPASYVSTADSPIPASPGASTGSVTVDPTVPVSPTGPAPRRVVPPSAVLPDPATPAPPRPGAPAPALDAVAVRRVWPDVVGKVNRTNKRIAALMRDAVVRELDGDMLVLTVKSTVLAKMMADHAAVLTDALYEELGGRWQIRCEVAGERGGASLSGPPRSQPATPARPAASPAATPTAGPTSAPPAVPGSPAAGSPSVPGSNAAPGTNPASGFDPASGSNAAPGSNPAPGLNPGSGPNAAPGSNPGSGIGAAAGTNAPSGNAAGPGAVTPNAPSGAAGPTSAPRTAVNPTGPASRGGVGAGGGGQGAGRQGAVPSAPAADDEGDWPEAARPGGGAPVAEATDDEDWPEAAQPGGASAGSGSSPDGSQPASASTGANGGDANGSGTNGGAVTGTNGTGTNGGGTNGGGTNGGGANGAGPGGSGGPGAAAGGGRPGGRGNPTPAARQPATAGGAPVSSAIAAARAAAAGRGARTGAAARPVADAEWAGEPPYDPDFDGPTRAGRPGGAAPAATPVYEGFDPGDEPLDEIIDEKTARESSEEQAVRLLREAFGAEKINEVDAR
ncbi:DNA polymerase III subunit gamma and tau [Micromonospora sp. DH14]|uniref:DNA polymerase III subunit gamma and tau n=1 Tax=Micromonospora sp. DH14 TaxID=3040120 RepID=UPI0024414D12|nr:DNA polymerase III subunit gamma and tau [Micromonospora sp. DH14]MDG9673239.1 DNA polymerase III subunit gamma and tau [Micromonospora sp. DH14]